MFTQILKDFLVRRGPKSYLTQLALGIQAHRRDAQITFCPEAINVKRDRRLIKLALRDFYLVPMVLDCFDQYFAEMQSQSAAEMEMLDFSTPANHTYMRTGVTLRFPGMPEEDSISAYTHWYSPKSGDLVFDVGAHAGFTSCMFAKLVGPSGRVVAFEPDLNCVSFLIENALAQGLKNITVVRKAMDSQTGTAFFNADGTMGAGLIDHLVYGETGKKISVDTISLEDACAQFGMPEFIKIDIEGAEIAVIQSCCGFLERHPVHLAFDSGHRMRDGRFTWEFLEPMLRASGYDVASSSEYGQMYTWARPKRQPSQPPHACTNPTNVP